MVWNEYYKKTLLEASPFYSDYGILFILVLANYVKIKTVSSFLEYKTLLSINSSLLYSCFISGHTAKIDHLKIAQILFAANP